jgi:hypothetical protein
MAAVVSCCSCHQRHAAAVPAASLGHLAALGGPLPP